jgi:hypothetical protein
MYFSAFSRNLIFTANSQIIFYVASLKFMKSCGDFTFNRRLSVCQTNLINSDLVSLVAFSSKRDFSQQWVRKFFYSHQVLKSNKSLRSKKV